MYFKRPNGDVVEYDKTRHDLESFKARFEECDKDGNPVKKEKKAKKAKLWQSVLKRTLILC